jgi:uncharacterized protein YndB with AHSA1/START domain
MSKNNSKTSTPSDREFVMERTFDAPRKLVFEAFSDCKHLTHWWGPKDWTLPVCKIDFRPGGVWHYCMRGPEGDESWGKAIYREIVEPERIVYLDTFADEAGNPLALRQKPSLMVGTNRLVVRRQDFIHLFTESAIAYGILLYFLHPDHLSRYR